MISPSYAAAWTSSTSSLNPAGSCLRLTIDYSYDEIAAPVCGSS
jgi:hypothetical protein